MCCQNHALLAGHSATAAPPGPAANWLTARGPSAWCRTCPAPAWRAADRSHAVRPWAAADRTACSHSGSSLPTASRRRRALRELVVVRISSYCAGRRKALTPALISARRHGTPMRVLRAQRELPQRGPTTRRRRTPCPASTASATGTRHRLCKRQPATYSGSSTPPVWDLLMLAQGALDGDRARRKQ